MLLVLLDVLGLVVCCVVGIIVELSYVVQVEWYVIFLVEFFCGVVWMEFALYGLLKVDVYDFVVLGAVWCFEDDCIFFFFLE